MNGCHWGEKKPYLGVLTPFISPSWHLKGGLWDVQCINLKPRKRTARFRSQKRHGLKLEDFFVLFGVFL